MNAGSLAAGLGTRWSPGAVEHRQLAIQRSILEDAADDHAPDKTIGVVFVHGVGSQTESSTLRENAEPLIDWLREWHHANNVDGFTVGSSVLSYGEETEGPARIRIHIPAFPRHRGATSQDWVLAEGWWAPRILAPSFTTMLGWTRRVLGRVVDRLIKRSLTEHPIVDPPPPGWRRWPRYWFARAIERVSGGFLTFSYVAALFALTPLTALLFLVAKIPIPGVEEFVLLKLVRPLLLEGVGDFYTYLHDDAQAIHARRSVQEAVCWLVQEERCDQVVVVAHSGGTVVAFDALGDRRGDADHCVHDTAALGKVVGLVTLGAALNNAWQPGLGPTPPRRLTDEICRKGSHRTWWLNVWSAFDYVCGGPIDEVDPRLPHQTPDHNIRVTNSLSAMNDHGGYFTNLEEYLPRLAQFIEHPAERHRSRFWSGARVDWVRRRNDRVTTLVAWRQWAYVCFAAALIARQLDGRLVRDGAAILDFVKGLPLAGGPVKGISDILVAAPDWLQTLGAFWVAVLVWVTVCALVYAGIVSLVFDPWTAREGRRSIGPEVLTEETRGQKREIAGRTLGVVVAIFVVAVGVAVFGDIAVSFTAWAVLGAFAVLWWAVWAVWLPRQAERSDEGVREGVPALRLVRELGVGALAGAAAGVLVAGFGSRIAMRISGFAAGSEGIGQATENGNLVGQVTVGGTLSLVVFVGIFAGAFGGIVYVALRPWLAGLGRWRGLGFGLLLLAAGGSLILDPGNGDFRRFGPPLLNVAMFAALFPLFGLALAPLAAALERYAPADPERPLGGGHAAVNALIWIAGIGALLVFGLLVVENLGELAAGRGGEEVVATNLVLVVGLAFALGIRVSLAYAGDRSSLGGRLWAASAVVLVAVVVGGLARTVSGIGEIVR